MATYMCLQMFCDGRETSKHFQRVIIHLTVGEILFKCIVYQRQFRTTFGGRGLCLIFQNSTLNLESKVL